MISNPLLAGIIVGVSVTICSLVVGKDGIFLGALLGLSWITMI